MYFKMSINNVKKNFKDYGIYFITLMLAVAIFYNFNSITSQKAMEDINKIKELSKVIKFISVFISVVFGGLIIYANNALVKKRKKEFGIYATLGMSKLKVSKILVCEIFIVGIISLISGLLAGILLSRGVSVLTARLFEFDMSNYEFTISMNAINKTFMYFGVIFIIVMVFNTISVSKNKLIDMINASKKSEYVKVRNPIILFIIFILSLFVLGTAYYIAWKYIPNPKHSIFIRCVPIGILGTILFFFGLSGFMMTVLKKSKKIYFNKLNVFVIKQFSNKINTNFISMSIISLMIFITIFIMSMSLSLKVMAEKQLKDIPFDASITLSTNDDKQKIPDMKEALKVVDFKLKDSYNYEIMDYYETNFELSRLLNDYASKELQESLKKYDGKLIFIKESQYNNITKLIGGHKIDLKENEILLMSNNDDKKEAIESLMKKEKEIKIGDKNYILKDNKNAKWVYPNFVAVVDDFNIKNMGKSWSIISINVGEKDKKELEMAVDKINRRFRNFNYANKPNGIAEDGYKKYGFSMYGESKSQKYNDSKRGIGTILYIGVYIGIVFLISSSVVLGIQQLTEAGDSINRYKALKKIGVSDDMIDKTIFYQILVHFMMPLSLGIIHFIAAMVVISRPNAISIVNNLSPILITTISIILIYSGYLYATYLTYKNTIRNN